MLFTSHLLGNCAEKRLFEILGMKGGSVETKNTYKSIFEISIILALTV